MKTKQKSDESGAETVKVAGAALRGILRKITAVSLTFAQCSVEQFSVVHSVLGELCLRTMQYLVQYSEEKCSQCDVSCAAVQS